MSHLSRTVGALLRSGARKATMYVDRDMTVKATRQRKPDKRDRTETLIITYGKPNYAEREFIKACKRAGEPLPVRKIQLKFWPEVR